MADIPPQSPQMPTMPEQQQPHVEAFAEQEADEVGSVRSADGSCSTNNSSLKASPQHHHRVKPKVQPMAAMAQPLAPPCGHLDDDEDYDDEETVGSNSTASHNNDDDNNNNNPAQRQRRRGRQRTIQFLPPNELAIYHDGADIEELAQNRRDIWYQYEELKTIKRKALVISKEAQRVGLGQVLTNTYGKSCQETQEALNVWTTASGAVLNTSRRGSSSGNNSSSTASRRGLERWINEEYAAKRSDIRKRTIQSVLRAQAKMKDSALDDPDYASKVLSRLSEAFSIDSKQFARGMGVADALAASDQHHHDQDEDPTESGSVISDLDSSSHHQKQLPSRKNSPNSVMVAPNNNNSTPPSRSLSRKKQQPSFRIGKRNLSITAPSVSADFRHYY